jgi:hypothetical protein
MSPGFATHGTLAYWHVAPPAAGTYYAGQTHWTYSSVSVQDNWATWTPPRPLDGDYLVVAFIPSNYADTQHAQYRIHHNGSVDTKEVNQSFYWGDWAILGLFDFTAGTDSYVSLSDVTGEDGNYVAFDAVAFISADVDPPPGAIVVNDADAGFATYGPSEYWHIAPPAEGIYYAGQTHWTRNSESVQHNWAIWTPSTPLDGNYRVYVFIPSNYADTEQALYLVYHSGQVDTVGINQSIYLGDWAKLGVFDFTSSTAGYVLLSDVTGEQNDTRYVAFDAVAFVPNNVYLPLVLRDLPPKKEWTGMHLGNRMDDWRPPGAPADFLTMLDPATGGTWPAAVVVMSDQLYNIERSPTAPCGVTDATVRNPQLYDYVKRASQAGVWVVIRIHPSPGNFEDWDEPPYPNHQLRSDTTPAGGNYCWGDHWPDPERPFGYHYFRAIDDVADEMNAIHALNTSNGWEEFGFLPANEPNVWWYNDDSTPKRYDAEAWRDMNDYFVAVYDYTHAHYPGVKVFTPPMAQQVYAEELNMNSCTPMGVEGQPGYNYMWDTYAPKNDGYTWNNYYWYGEESWPPCPSGGHHVSQHFPTWLQGELDFTEKPRIITEADLASPWIMGGGSPLADKDTDGGYLAAASLRQFAQAEGRADAIVFWLLTDTMGNLEHDWHEAYNDGGSVRPWFNAWWPADEEWP